MPTGSLNNHAITFDSTGNLYFVPSGSTTIGVSQSAAIAQVVEISMSVNDNNYHTPVNNTSSFFMISGSTNPDHFYTIAYTSEEKIHKHRILTMPNSSSLTSSYGSQGGRYFEFTSSRNGYDHSKFKLWYSNPKSKTHGSSSIINISQISSSQTNQATGSQYFYQISASAGTVFTFVPTGSDSVDIIDNNLNPEIANTYYFYHVSSGSNGFIQGAPSSSQEEGPLLYTSVSQSLKALADVINEYKSIIGVSVTASGETIQFTATQSGQLPNVYSFMTQSLVAHETLTSFGFAGDHDITSSAPPIGGCDYLIEVPIDYSASQYSVATASMNVINSNNFLTSYMSASVSGSESDLYGLVIASFKPGYFGYVTGSTNPTFTYEIAQSGSKNILPNFDNRVGHIIEVPVENGATTARMVSQSILSINNFTGGTSQAGSLVGSGSYTSDTMYISASYCAPNAFRITNLYGGAVNDVSMSGNRITASIIVSGSGEFQQSLILGSADPQAAAATLLIDVDDKSFILSGSGENKIYMSGSGDKMGFNTTDPIKQLDFRADEMQFSRKGEQKGMRITKNGDMESFNFDATSASTGSELIMSYQAGGISVLSQDQAGATLEDIGFMTSAEFIDISDSSFGGDVIATLNGLFKEGDVLKIISHAQQLGFFGQASVGDNIGTIRWAVQSGSGDSDIRGAGEAATIKGIVSSVNNDTGGVTAKLDFAIAKTTGNPATKLFSIDPSVGIVCSSSLILATGNPLLVGSADADGVDRLIRYRHATAPFVMGVDDSRNVLAIHSSTGFNNSGTNEFEMTSGGLASFKYSLGVGTVLSVGTTLTVGGYGRIDGLRVGTTSTSPGDGNLYIENDITNVIDVTSVGTGSFGKLHVTDVNIVGQRHILWQSGLYINDNPYIVDKGYFGSSIGQTPSNWNNLTDACFDSSAGTFVHQVDITEDQHGSMCFFAPFAISRIEALSSWRTAATGDDEGFWCGIWTGSAGQRLGDTSGAHGTTKNIGFLTGSKHVFSNGGNWEGQNNDLDVSVSLPAFTQIYYGHGTTETSGVGAKNTRGHITLMVYEA